MNRPQNLARPSELEWETLAHGDLFELRRKRLAATAGARHLGCSLYEVPPGKCAWPRHAHLGNEEAVFVLSGRGVVRQGEADSEITTGDYLTFRRGKEHVHQIVNTGTEPLRYLCMSTMNEPDISWYPDSRKFGLFAGAAPGGDKASRSVNTFLPEDASVDYWEGESPRS